MPKGFHTARTAIGLDRGYERPDDPPIPSVMLTGDELLHLQAFASIASLPPDPDRPKIHEAEGGVPNKFDPHCPICVSLWGLGGKIPELLEHCGGNRG